MDSDFGANLSSTLHSTTKAGSMRTLSQVLSQAADPFPEHPVIVDDRQRIIYNEPDVR